MSKIFEVGQAGIENGITLIEASAGTGKTFAIAGMAVRLIAEKGLGISQILIVTFTEAATHELRERVRSRIRQAAAFLEEGRLGEDPALAPFLDAPQDEIQLAVQRLKTALLSFDEATIFTIHGFCQRMLRENAFETGALFDVEVLSDAEPIWRETAEDFWRKSFYDAHPQLGAVVYCLQEAGALSSTSLVELLRKLSRHPDLQILTGTSSRLRIGEAELELLHPCVRCVMVTKDPDTQETWAHLLRHLVRRRDAIFGINARPLRPARIAAGDPVELVTA